MSTDTRPSIEELGEALGYGSHNDVLLIRDAIDELSELRIVVARVEALLPDKDGDEWGWPIGVKVKDLREALGGAE